MIDDLYNRIGQILVMSCPNDAVKIETGIEIADEHDAAGYYFYYFDKKNNKNTFCLILMLRIIYFIPCQKLKSIFLITILLTASRSGRVVSLRQILKIQKLILNLSMSGLLVFLKMMTNINHQIVRFNQIIANPNISSVINILLCYKVLLFASKLIVEHLRLQRNGANIHY